MKTIIEAYRDGLFNKKFWLPNILSGIIVGIIALPLAMAFAIASGVKPEQGLYTAMIAGLLVSLFGGSRLQIAGPTGAFIVVLAGITAQYGVSGLQLATLMAGCLLLLMGLFRFGKVIQFIPTPVILGFTAGIAVVIWVGQWSYFFGIPAPHGAHFHEKFLFLLNNLPQLNLHTTLIGVSSLALVIFANKLPLLKRVPGPIIALIVASTALYFLNWSDVATIGSTFGGIPSGLPAFKVPEWSVDRVIELIGPACTIAMLGAIESLLSAVVADGMAGTRHNSNRELVGQGIANIFTPLFGGFAATGAIARTATNIRNGGNSPMAGVVHSITIMLVILFLAPLATNVPLAALAAILFVVAWNMSEVAHALQLIKQAPKADVVILIVTFLLTIFVDLVVAVNIGVVLAIGHFLLSMSSSVEPEQQTKQKLQTENPSHPPLPEHVLVYDVNGPFFFGVADKIHQALSTISHDLTSTIVVIRFRWVPFIDITGLNAFKKIINTLHQRNIRVILCGATQHVTEKLHKVGITQLLSEQNIYNKLDEALGACAV